MSALLNLARAGYEMEKSSSDTTAEKLARTAGAATGAAAGGVAGSYGGAYAGMRIGAKVPVKAYGGLVGHVVGRLGSTVLGGVYGGITGATAGAIGGGMLGHKAVKSIQKKAGLLDIARAGYEMEKSAAEDGPTDSTGRKIARGIGAGVGGYAGYNVGHVAGAVGNGLRVGAGAVTKHPNASKEAINKIVRKAGNKGGKIGAVAGLGLGAMTGLGIVGHSKKAGLLDIAKGIGSVGLNLAKQHPNITKAVAGGAAAGVAGAVAKKVLTPSQPQTKQAAQTAEGHRGSVVAGLYAGAGAGAYGVHKATEAHRNAVQKVHGVETIHRRANETAIDRKSALGQTDRAALYKKLAPSAKVSLPNKLWSKATQLGTLHTPRNMIAGVAGGAALGAYAGHKVYNAFNKPTHEKAAAAANRALDKEEKAGGGPVNVTGKVVKAPSSLIASAKAEMAKPA